MKAKLTILAIVLNTAMHCQSLLWSIPTFTGTNTTSIFNITTDPSGNVFTTGWFNGTTDFDPGSGVYNLTSTSNAAFVSKLDKDGNFIWAVKLSPSNNTGSNGKYDIKTDGLGNVYVIGFFKGQSDFDPGLGTFNLSPDPIALYFPQFIWKLDPNGNFLWAQAVDGNVQIYSCTTDAIGNLFVCGSFQNTADMNWGSGISNLTAAGSYDGFISKLDPSGNLLDVKQFGYSNSNVSIRSTVLDINSNIIAMGTYSGVVDADPGPGTQLFNIPSGNFFISKMNPNLNFISALEIIAPVGSCEVKTMNTDKAGNVYVTGTYSGTCDFDPSPASYTMQTASSALFLCKLDANGNFNWSKDYVATAMNVYYHLPPTIDAGGNIFFTSGATYTTGTVDADPGPGSNLVPADQGFISILNSSGNFVSAISPTFLINVHVDIFGDVYNTNSLGISKYGSIFTNISTYIKDSYISIFPNPGNGEFTLKTSALNNEAHLEIFNGLGQKLQQQKIDSQSTNIDLTNYEGGIYLVRILDKTNTIHQTKIIKQ